MSSSTFRMASAVELENTSAPRLAPLMRKRCIVKRCTRSPSDSNEHVPSSTSQIVTDFYQDAVMQNPVQHLQAPLQHEEYQSVTEPFVLTFEINNDVSNYDLQADGSEALPGEATKSSGQMQLAGSKSEHVDAAIETAQIQMEVPAQVPWEQHHAQVQRDMFFMLDDTLLDLLGVDLQNLEQQERAQKELSYPLGDAVFTQCAICFDAKDLNLRPCCGLPACNECLQQYFTVSVLQANVKVSFLIDLLYLLSL